MTEVTFEGTTRNHKTSVLTVVSVEKGAFKFWGL